MRNGTGRENAHIAHCLHCGWIGASHPGLMSPDLMVRCNCGRWPHYIAYEAGVEDEEVAAILDRLHEEGRRVRFSGNPLMASRRR